MSTAPIEDDSWSDLAAELGVQPKAPTPPPPAAEPAARPATPDPEPDPELDVAGGDDLEPDAGDAEPDDTVVIPALATERVAEGPPGEDAAGQGGRKRRRRRRRRKKGAPGQPADANGPAEAAADADEDEAADADDAADESFADEDVGGPEVEEPAAEAARDVIANWNVPSWEEIVAGLYRPDR